MNKFYQFLLFAFVVLIGSSCTNMVEDPVEIELSLKSKALIEADNAFGLEMFKLIHNEENDNFNISPLSISQALSMTYNGARAETKAAMEVALKKAGFTVDEINKLNQQLVKALLEADDKVTLGIAQSIWYSLGFNVLQEFKTVNQIYYDAEVNELNFGRDDALDIINGWIEDKTHGKIEDMIERIEPDHVMLLVNAIYFYGEWRSKFDKNDTSQQAFTKEDDSVVQVDMMMKKDSANYLSTDIFTAIELPYGRGNFNMVLMVPNHGHTCNDIAEELTPQNWNNWMGSFTMFNDINIWLPKFKAEYEIKLNDVLSAMGMPVAFTPAADFSGINGSGDIYIDYVQHNTFIEVDENGTEAAAATVVAIREYVAMPNYFKADKPFIYAITEKSTGAILFMGKVAEPKQ
jgi:serine protease inhibitor